MLGMTVDARAGETLSVNRLNGHFQSRLRIVYTIYDRLIERESVGGLEAWRPL